MFRGLTVALMILVNSPGSWARIYGPLRHAQWHGLTPTDLVFPFFLFIVGVAMALSLSRRLRDGASRGDLVRKIVSRSVIIFLLGLFLNGFPFGIPLNAGMAADFSLAGIPASLADLRIPGVLQRIALCYLLAGLSVVLTGRVRHPGRARILVMIGCLTLYELLMRLPLVPGWGAGSFELPDNFARWVDLRLLGAAHIYRVRDVSFDPEGLVSTLPAIVTTMAGFLVGEYIRGPLALTSRLRGLGSAGLALAVAGLLACLVEPLNKQLWTVSYVLLTTGLAMLVLAASTWMIDVRRWRTGTLPAVVFGSNPLVVFMGSGLLARVLAMARTVDSQGHPVSWKRALYEGIFVPLAGPMNGSLLFAVVNVVFWLGILWILHRRKLFIKI